LISNPYEGYVLPTRTTGLETFLLIENCTPDHNVERSNCAEITAEEVQPMKEGKSSLEALIKVLAPDEEGIHCLICGVLPEAAVRNYN
jgi:hypothetical protein